jgi:hypothetical protein
MLRIVPSVTLVIKFPVPVEDNASPFAVTRTADLALPPIPAMSALMDLPIIVFFNNAKSSATSQTALIVPAQQPALSAPPITH